MGPDADVERASDLLMGEGSLKEHEVVVDTSLTQTVLVDTEDLGATFALEAVEDLGEEADWCDAEYCTTE